MLGFTPRETKLDEPAWIPGGGFGNRHRNVVRLNVEVALLFRIGENHEQDIVLNGLHLLVVVQRERPQQIIDCLWGERPGVLEQL